MARSIGSGMAPGARWLGLSLGLAALVVGCDGSGGGGGRTDSAAPVDGSSTDGLATDGQATDGQAADGGAADGGADAQAADLGVDGTLPALDAAPADVGLDASPPDAAPAEDMGLPPRDIQREPFDCDATWRELELGGVTLRERIIDPRCTDEAIDSCTPDGAPCSESKDHYVVVAAGDRRNVLWLHMGGSGGTPTGSSNISRIAALEGYHSVNLAYLNEPSVAQRCVNLITGEREPETCEGRVRAELITGTDITPQVSVDRPNSIEHRLERLLAHLHADDPTRGWDAFYTPATGLQWARIAVSGFSQGGGMAGMLSRDHAVARAVFFSKGAGSGGDLGGPCVTAEDCPSGRCCAPTDPECEEAPPADGRCVELRPVEWSNTGAGGVGTADSRATPGSRMYGIYHREESAALYSPQVFELWGMGTAGSAVDADVGPPFGDTHQFSSGLEPCAGGSFHQSMGNNLFSPKVGGCGGNLPAMAEAWRHMMTHEDLAPAP